MSRGVVSPVHFLKHFHASAFTLARWTLRTPTCTVSRVHTICNNVHTFHPALPRGNRQHRRHPHTGNGVPWRQGGGPTAHPRDERGLSRRTFKSRAREPAASVRTVSPRARAVQLAEGAPGCVARESAGPQTFAFGPKRERQASHTDHVTPVTGSAFVNCQYRSYTWKSCV